ncbi:MAG TPA: cyclodeaminase/cyclohydrolase family protein, partial [Thermomicrobiales bacterium]|nr:cyclodeaminase/cyclohydrolase family protein [Thermomicrobiales bacterium]
MTDSEQHRAGAGNRPIGALLAQIADPGQHVGGGTAAAVAAALAGASAALVANLSAGRKSNREHTDQIRADIDRLDELQSELLVAARDDEAALS